jgi:hypothetical protein
MQSGGDDNEKLVYSTDPEKIVKLARETGMSDLEIIRMLVRGVYGTGDRKRLIVSWAKALGREPSDLLREATRHGLIPNDRMPPKR